jgi:ribose transport system substrate-binding protein
MQWRCAVPAVLCLCVLALVTGCGSSGSSSGSTASTTEGAEAGAETSGGEAGGGEATSEGSSAVVDREVAKYLKGGFRPLPTSAPKPEPGKSIWVISFSQLFPADAIAAEATVEAAEKVGWSAKIVDGKGEPSVMSEGIDAATAAGADAVVVLAEDCGPIKGALERADAAGVVTFGAAGLNCDEKYGGEGKPLFTEVLHFGPIGTYGSLFQKEIAPAQAFYAIQRQEENGGTIVVFKETDNAIEKYEADGYAETFSKYCTGECKYKEYSLTYQDAVSGKIATKVSAALAQNPDASVLTVPYDAVITGGALEGVQSSGRASEISLVGTIGVEESLTLIRNGKQASSVFTSSPWTGWAAIDGLIRVFAEEPAVDSGMGAQLINETNLPPEGQEYEPPVDFRANYEKIWGVK